MSELRELILALLTVRAANEEERRDRDRIGALVLTALDGLESGAAAGRCPICKCAVDEEGNGQHSADCVDFRATLGEWYKMRKGEALDAQGLANNIRFEDFDTDTAAAAIGQYAYRYSEDIRKDRDEWKAMAVQYADAVKAKEAAK